MYAFALRVHDYVGHEQARFSGGGHVDCCSGLCSLYASDTLAAHLQAMVQAGAVALYLPRLEDLPPWTAELDLPDAPGQIAVSHVNTQAALLGNTLCCGCFTTLVP